MMPLKKLLSVIYAIAIVAAHFNHILRSGRRLQHFAQNVFDHRPISNLRLQQSFQEPVNYPDVGGLETYSDDVFYLLAFAFQYGLPFLAGHNPDFDMLAPNIPPIVVTNKIGFIQKLNEAGHQERVAELRKKLNWTRKKLMWTAVVTCLVLVSNIRSPREGLTFLIRTLAFRTVADTIHFMVEATVRPSAALSYSLMGAKHAAFFYAVSVMFRKSTDTYLQPGGGGIPLFTRVVACLWAIDFRRSVVNSFSKAVLESRRFIYAPTHLPVDQHRAVVVARCSEKFATTVVTGVAAFAVIRFLFAGFGASGLVLSKWDVYGHVILSFLVLSVRYFMLLLKAHREPLTFGSMMQKKGPAPASDGLVKPGG